MTTRIGMQAGGTPYYDVVHGDDGGQAVAAGRGDARQARGRVAGGDDHAARSARLAGAGRAVATAGRRQVPAGHDRRHVCAEAWTLMKYWPAAASGSAGRQSRRPCRRRPPSATDTRPPGPARPCPLAALAPVHVPRMRAARRGVGDLHVRLGSGSRPSGRGAHPARSRAPASPRERRRRGEHGVPAGGDRLRLGIDLDGAAPAPERGERRRSDQRTTAETHAIPPRETTVCFRRLYGGRATCDAVTSDTRAVRLSAESPHAARAEQLHRARDGWETARAPRWRAGWRRSQRPARAQRPAQQHADAVAARDRSRRPTPSRGARRRRTRPSRSVWAALRARNSTPDDAPPAIMRPRARARR